MRIKPIDEVLALAERNGLERSLGIRQLVLLGIGTILGTGIFVLIAQAAQKAGPAMLISFVIAAFVCAVTALCYAELSSMVPASGSAYTYCYAVFGEVAAWIVGWALLAEYAIAASAVSVGWSNYFVGFIRHSFHWAIPAAIAQGPLDGGIINVPATAIALVMATLLLVGTRISARVNAVLVTIKVAALAVFGALAIPAMQISHFEPFDPLGWFGISGAAASIFFAYVGFDAVVTAAEEARNPQRTLPVALILSLTSCTIIYFLVAAGVIGVLGAQPVVEPFTGHAVVAGSRELGLVCQEALHAGDLVCSGDALAHALRLLGWHVTAGVIGAAAFISLPSVILMCLFAQTRVFFVISRDGLLPAFGTRVHPRFRTPHWATAVTGSLVALAAALFPVGKLADLANAGTLMAFLMVSGGVLVLRCTQPSRQRPFRAPLIYLTAPLAIAGCAFLLYSLGKFAHWSCALWTGAGLLLYGAYGYRHSRQGARTYAAR